MNMNLLATILPSNPFHCSIFHACGNLFRQHNLVKALDHDFRFGSAIEEPL